MLKILPEGLRQEPPLPELFYRPVLRPLFGQGKSIEQYNEAVNDAIDFIRGGSAAALRICIKRMEEAAREP